jgi:anhydro-N-acetylmuramic acid kinase
MKKQEYFVVGVMSGTSLDGIDLAYIHLKKDKRWSYTIICAETVAYDTKWEAELRNGIGYSKIQLEGLNISYTQLLAEVIKTFVKKNQLKNIDAICSHGHTILHQPDNKLTLQIGNLEELSQLINQKVVCDFRVQDVMLGGQGAPLVPIGDQLLFSKYTYCVNLGGFSNISTALNKERVAYDICPVNIVLNHYIQKTGVSYDDKGMLASSGEICQLLLEKLNDINFYKLSPPKSLGLEWVKSTIFPLIDSYKLSIKDILRTFVEHVAIQIGSVLTKDKSSVLFTGGGVYNLFLMKRITEYSNAEIILSSPELIEYKEALIFGFLGVLKLRGEVNVLASVTGAGKNHSSGEIFLC